MKASPFISTILFLLLSACGDDMQSISKLPDDAIILAFGDSLTYGTGAKDDESYPVVLQELTHLKVINAGIPGEESESGLYRLSELLEQYKPQLLILCHGGNDLLRKKNIIKMESNIRAMIKLA